ncbi:MAG: flippase-like domain-containing protein [Burkholderiales bacterium]|nr:flippase-like domain-containing protein [Burkholderiales bacterium]
MKKWLRWAGWPVGIAILLVVVLHEGLGDIVGVIEKAGFRQLWLVPFHALPLLLDALAWYLLLDRRASLLFLWWIAAVREAVSRLLPSAGIGGEITGIRLASWRVPDTSLVSASVIVEVLVTIAVQYAFAALGLVLIAAHTPNSDLFRTVGLTLLLSIPIPVLTVVLLQRGGIFHAIERWARHLLGGEHPLLQKIDGKRLDADIDRIMCRTGLLLRAFLLQFGGYALGAFENYWALSMLGHPVSIAGALAIEALTQAVRHAAFMIPGGLGVQEITVIALAQVFGVDRDVALSLALVKRMREVLFGSLALGTWQLAEILRSRGLHLARMNEARPASLPD